MSDTAKRPKRKRLIAALKLAVQTLENVESRLCLGVDPGIDYAIAVAVEALRGTRD